MLSGGSFATHHTNQKVTPDDPDERANFTLFNASINLVQMPSIDGGENINRKGRKAGVEILLMDRCIPSNSVNYNLV